MIDFRYHLVSIISIFLALAVGIVLGAGPLKGGIGTTLTQELANARKDKAALNDEVLAARRLQTSANEFGDAVLPRIVTGTLGGRRVLLVVGPHASDAAVRNVEEVVARAGGSVTKRVALSNALVDSTDTSGRDAVLARLARPLGVDPPAESDPGVCAGTVLGRGLVQGAAGAPAYSPAAGTAVVDGLAEAKLVSTSDPQPGTNGAPVPTVAVVVPGQLSTETAQAKAQTDMYVGLARGLDAVAAGTAVVADRASASTPTGAAQVVSAVRSSTPAATAVTTVDDVDLPMGAAALALALPHELSGTAGRYGVLDDAQAVLPPLPPAAKGQPSRPTPTAGRP